jgi:hypothetical protein
LRAVLAVMPGRDGKAGSLIELESWVGVRLICQEAAALSNPPVMHFYARRSIFSPALTRNEPPPAIMARCVVRATRARAGLAGSEKEQGAFRS